MAIVRDFQVNNGLEVNLNANVVNAVSASDFIQSNPERAYSPTVVFDFSKSERLDPRITFIRASSATYTAANGLIASVGNNVPRFQFENGQNQGLFVESQRTNISKYSNDFFSSISNQFVPGSYTFFDSSLGLRQSSLGMVANQDYAVSVYIKINAQSNQTIGVNIGDFDANTFNANTAPVGQWVRYTGIRRLGPSGDILDIRINNPKLGTTNQIWPDPSTIGVVTRNFGIAPNGQRESTRVNWTATDNTLFDMEVWGTQVELGSYVTSFIPTGATSATRFTDAAYVDNLTNTLNLNPYQGAFLFVGTTNKRYNANTPSFDQGTCGLLLQDSNFGLQNNYFSVVFRDDVASAVFTQHVTISSNGVSFNSTGGGSNFFFTNTEIRSVTSYTYTSSTKQLNVAASSNGVSNTTPNANFSTAFPFPSRYLVFGQYYAPGNRTWNGTIKKVAYYNRVFSNNEVITLTTI